MRCWGWVTVVAVMASLLAACGGSDDATQTGVFVGPVIGLRYETQTQSGLTSAAGEFTYAQGERVSFSVGGILLGSAKGAERLSAFDLFGTAPPTDAIVLRQLLTDRVITPFDRAANVTLFLQSLDDDRDPANGIDVTAWGASLAGQGLSFGDEVWDFPAGKFQRFAAVHGGVDRRLDAAAPLVHLYGQLGLSVSGRARSTLTVDGNHDGVVDQRGTYEYDVFGRETRGLFDNDVNGVVDRDSSIVYSPRGSRALQSFRFDTDGDGVLERVEVTERTFDDDGNEKGRLVQDTTNGVIGLKQTYEVVYDAAGNMRSARQSNDNGGNGSVETIYRDLYTYDPIGRRIGTRRESDTNGDGTAERVDTTQQQWNDRDLVTEVVRASDGDADGTPESATTVTSSYDTSGNLIEQTSTTVTGGLTTGSQHGVYTYDENDHRLSSVVDEDNDGDGSVDFQRRVNDTYTPDGRRLDEVTETDANHDGTFDSRQLRRNGYDAASNLESAVLENDNDADGTVDSRSATTYTFDELGNVLTRRNTNDSGNDGVLELDSLETYEYSDIADGLYLLLYQAVVD